jgi:foldase protein PrsA
MSGARKSGLIIFGAVFVLLFAYVAIAEGIGNPSVPSGDIALVEDVPDDMGNLSQEEYDRAFLQTWKRGGLNAAPEAGDAQFDQIHEAAINDLLDQAWLTGEAADLGVAATDREIDNEFQTIRSDQFPNEAAFQNFLKESNFTEDEVLDRVRLQVLSRKIEEKITNGVNGVPEDQLEEFYESSKENFTTPETRDIRLIVTDNQADADKVEAALDTSAENEDYAKLAKQFSTNGSSSQGGKTVATQGAFPDPVGAEVMSAEEGAVLGPIEADGDFYFFKVDKVNPEETQTLDDVRQQIRQQLLPTLQQQAMSDFVSNYNAKWTSRTFCADDYTVARCSNFEGDSRLESADPACYEDGAADADPALSCPAGVGLSAPQSPGGDSLDPLAPAGGANRPQGPVPTGDAEDAAAAAAAAAGAGAVPPGGAGGVQQVPVQ